MLALEALASSAIFIPKSLSPNLPHPTPRLPDKPRHFPGGIPAIPLLPIHPIGNRGSGRILQQSENRVEIGPATTRGCRFRCHSCSQRLNTSALGEQGNGIGRQRIAARRRQIQSMTKHPESAPLHQPLAPPIVPASVS